MKIVELQNAIFSKGRRKKLIFAMAVLRLF